MSVKMICASHSPLMLVDMEPTREGAQEAFFDALSTARRELEAFDPELVVVFGPDHYNGFFYDLMPSFCIGVHASGREDWGLKPGKLSVASDLSLACVDQLLDDEFDVAVSYDMKVDHGITIPLFELTGGLDRYPVLPVFINCAARPRPNFRRVRKFGDAVGRFLAESGKRVAVIGSGGISHDPPTPRIETAPPELQQRLIERRIPTREELQRREDNVVRLAKELVQGRGPCLPPNEAWDRQFLADLMHANQVRLDAISDAEIDREAGLGGHEVRCWVAAYAAAHALGMRDSRLSIYELIPEWLTGMALAQGQG